MLYELGVEAAIKVNMSLHLVALRKYSASTFAEFGALRLRNLAAQTTLSIACSKTV